MVIVHPAGAGRCGECWVALSVAFLSNCSRGDRRPLVLRAVLWGGLSGRELGLGALAQAVLGSVAVSTSSHSSKSIWEGPSLNCFGRLFFPMGAEIFFKVLRARVWWWWSFSGDVCRGAAWGLWWFLPCVLQGNTVGTPGTCRHCAGLLTVSSLPRGMQQHALFHCFS